MRTRPDFRKNSRHFVRQGARLVLPDGSDVVMCLIIDISAAGARLQVKNPDALPDYFTLLLSHGGQLRRHCSIIWRSESAIGVEFVPESPLTVGQTPR
jgi:PilZ domain-containing protein